MTAVLVEQGELERIRAAVDETRTRIAEGHPLAAAESVNEAITYLDAVQARMDAGGEQRFGDVSDYGPAVRPA